MTEATVVALNSVTGGTLNTGNDRDCFSVIVTEPGILTIDTTETTGAGDSGSTLSTLVNSNGDVLKMGGGDNSDDVMNVNVAPGTYYFTIELLDVNSNIDNYSTDVSFVAAPAISVEVNSTTSAEMFEEVSDVYKITVTESGTLSVATSGDDVDTHGTLSHLNGNVIGTNEDIDSDDYNFNITSSVAAGTYYVVVRGYDEYEEGDYDFVVTFNP